MAGNSFRAGRDVPVVVQMRHWTSLIVSYKLKRKGHVSYKLTDVYFVSLVAELPQSYCND